MAMSHDEAHDWRVEVWNALSHGAGFLASLVAGAVLLTLVAKEGDGRALAATIVYVVSLVCVYASSTLYHGVPHLPAKRALKIVDHCAIFLLIAGTYTPFTLIALRGSIGWWLFGIAWGIAAIGIGLKLFHTGKFKGASTVAYLAMGWLAVAAIKPFLRTVPAATLGWLLAGGLAYTVGTVFYMSRRRHAHAIWHGFVLAGSACHFVAVAMQVLGYDGPTLL
jgi:hemolysin III